MVGVDVSSSLTPMNLGIEPPKKRWYFGRANVQQLKEITTNAEEEANLSQPNGNRREQKGIKEEEGQQQVPSSRSKPQGTKRSMK